MNQKSVLKCLWATLFLVCLMTFNAGMNRLHSQSSTGTIQGAITDPAGPAVQGATVAVLTESQVVQKATTGADGKFVISGLPAGTYEVQISAPGFSTFQRSISVAAGSNTNLPIVLSIASVSQEVTVEAEADNSIAAQLAPVKSLLDAGSARTEISSNYVSEYTSPVTDFADIIQAAPGTVSFTTNGIGNGQAKIYFRGFVDDDYSMTWDGVPFNDSNDPSHHSWAYIPAAAIGHVDFDRSPGTASDIATSNFGGTIHFFSPELSDEARVRLEGTYGSWNTYQILGDINSGVFLHGKAHFWLNADYQSSDGYQTFSPKQDVAATAKFDYKFSDRTYLSVIGTNIIVDAFTNNDPTRRQLFHSRRQLSLRQHPDELCLRVNLQVLLRPAVLALLRVSRGELLRHRLLQPRLRRALEAHDKNLHLRLLQPPALPEQNRPGSDHRPDLDYCKERGRRRRRSAHHITLLRGAVRRASTS